VFKKNTAEKIQVSLKSDNNNDILHEDNVQFCSHLAEFFKAVFSNFSKIALFVS